MDSLKKMPADSISYMKYYSYLNKFGNAGKYGALVVYTKSYKFRRPFPLVKISPSGWLAIEHSETISNNLSLEEKQSAFKAFVRHLSLVYIKTDFNGFKYLSRLPNTPASINFTMAVTSRGDVTDTDPVILMPHYDRFADRNGNKLPWFFGALAIGWSVSLIILLCIPLRTALPAESTEA